MTGNRYANWVRWVVDPPPAPEEPVELGPCARCLAEDHEACVGVGCYRCDHTGLRRHGSAATGDRSG